MCIMSKIDDNREYVIMGENPSHTAQAVLATSSGELLIEFVVDGSFGATYDAKIDDNRGVSIIAENPSNNILALITDSNGYLILDTTDLIVS